MSRPKLSVTSPPPLTASADPEALWQSAASLADDKLDWLLPERLCRGALCIVEGETSTGKTTFLAALAASITTGAPLLGRGPSAPMDVLWTTSEESAAAMVRPRLVSAGADLERVHFPSADRNGRRRKLRLPSDVEMLRQGIDRCGAILIIIEPLISHIAIGYDIGHDSDARAVLDPLQELAMDTHATVIVTRGLTKSRAALRTARGKGNAQIGDTARCTLLIERPDEDLPARLLRTVKTAGAAPPPTLAYEITGPPGAPVIVGWRPLTRSEDITSESPPDLIERDVRRDAESLLRSILADGPVPAAAIEAAALRAVISSGALRRAKATLGVRSVHDGYGAGSEWRWAAPEDGFPAPLGGCAHSVAPLAPLGKPQRKRSGKSKGAKGATECAHPPKAPRKRRTGSTAEPSADTMQ